MGLKWACVALLAACAAAAHSVHLHLASVVLEENRPGFRVLPPSHNESTPPLFTFALGRVREAAPQGSSPAQHDVRYDGDVDGFSWQGACGEGTRQGGNAGAAGLGRGGASHSGGGVLCRPQRRRAPWLFPFVHVRARAWARRPAAPPACQPSPPCGPLADAGNVSASFPGPLAYLGSFAVNLLKANQTECDGIVQLGLLVEIRGAVPPLSPLSQFCLAVARAGPAAPLSSWGTMYTCVARNVLPRDAAKAWH